MAAVTLVQSVSTAEFGFGGETVVPISLPSPSKAGNTLIVAINLYGQGGGADIPNVVSVSDGTNVFRRLNDAGNSSDVQRTGNSWGQHVLFYCATNIVGLATETVTGTWNEAAWAWVAVWEVTPAVFDKAVTATGSGTSGSTTTSPGTLTPSAAGAFLCAASNFDGSNNAFNANPPWTVLRNDNAGGGSMYTASRTQVAPAPETASFVNVASGANVWSASMVSFIPPPVPVVGAPMRWFAGRAIQPSLFPAVRRAFVPVLVPPGPAPVALTPSAQAVATAAVALTAPAQMAASATAVALASAALAAPSALTGSAAAVSQAVVTLTAPALITPTATAVSLAIGTLTAPALITPTATAVAAASGTLTAPALVTPTATAVAGASCVVTAAGVQALTPVAQAIAQASAQLTAPTALTASAAAVSGASAQTTAPAALTASATAVSLASATVKTTAPLVPVAQAIAQAQLTLVVPGVVFLTPTAQAQAAASCLVTSGGASIAPVAQAVAAATSFLTAASNLTATASSISAATCAVTSGGVPISPQATAVASATLAMRTSMQLLPAAQAVGASALVVRVPQGLFANATAVARATLSVGLPGSLYPTARAVSAASATVVGIALRKLRGSPSHSMARTLELGENSTYNLMVRASPARDTTGSTE